MRCTIKFKGVCNVKYMSFGLMGDPLTKVQRTDSGSVAGSYALAYEYGDADHPTAPSQIGHERYTYNAAGERIVKSHGYLEGVYVNGAPQGLTSDCVDFRLHLGKASKLLFHSACTEVPRDGGLHHLPRTHTQRYAPAFHQALFHRRQTRGLQNRCGHIPKRLRPWR